MVKCRITIFKFTIFDPLIREVIYKGSIPKDGVVPAFRDFPWADMLAKLRTAREEDICFSPSVEFTNVDDGHGFTVSIVEDKKETVFYLFYKESANDSPAELVDQSAEATIDALGDFVVGRYDQLRQRFAAKVQPNSGCANPWWKFWA